ncbi:MAG: hypothetical protein HY364_04360 [Candidatus Aenigmarchaeota archaeon]|nr:hypothetical protein [Candidatus Aenigmarchaeota archaeon]
MLQHDKRVNYLSGNCHELMPYFERQFGVCSIMQSNPEYKFTNSDGTVALGVTVPDVMLWVNLDDGRSLCVPVEVKNCGEFEAIRGKAARQAASLYKYLDRHPELKMDVPGIFVAHGGTMNGRKWQNYKVEFMERY